MDWRDTDPEGLRLPIKIDTTSNGEFVPIPLSRANRLGNRLALEQATANARRTGSNPLTMTTPGVSSMITSTPVAFSKARMFLPSRPIIRPFISSLGS